MSDHHSAAVSSRGVRGRLVVVAVLVAALVAGPVAAHGPEHEAVSGPGIQESGPTETGEEGRAVSPAPPVEAVAPSAAEVGFIPTYHPIFVHLTIGLLAGAILFELGGVALGSGPLLAASYWNLIAAAPAALAAVLTGYREAGRAHTHGQFADQIHALLEYHEHLGYALLATVVLLALWRQFAPTRRRGLYRALLAAAGLGLVVQGYLGGEMVYRYGNGVRAPLAERLGGVGGPAH